MSNEEVMNLMVEMGLHEGGMENWVMDNAWVAFANRVAEAEREACAKVAENRMLSDASVKENVAHHTACKNIAADIRARGQA